VGMLAEIEEDTIYLEDGEDNIKLDIGKASEILPATYTEASVIIVGGTLNGNAFKVDLIAPPPIESRQKTLGKSSFPNYGLPISDSIVWTSHRCTLIQCL